MYMSWKVCVTEYIQACVVSGGGRAQPYMLGLFESVPHRPMSRRRECLTVYHSFIHSTVSAMTHAHTGVECSECRRALPRAPGI